MREPALEAGERSGEPLDLVGDHAIAEPRVRIRVAVGVDEELVDLREEPLDRVHRHRLAAEVLEPLVHAPHAAALAAREHDAGDAAHAPLFCRALKYASAALFTTRSAPVNSR